MRRLCILAAFLVVVSLIPVSAQRGGVRMGFGGRGVGMGRPAGGHAFGGMRPAPSVRFTFGGGSFGGVRFRTRGFHHCRDCRSRFIFPWYAGFGYGYYPPFWWWDSSSSYDYDREREIALANQMNALSIQEQSLREREDWLREREEDAYERQAPVRQEPPAAPAPPTVLVFRDQHRQEVSNYAIADGTLWVLSDHLLARKIPLADLDLSATTKANDERGVEFQVPK